MLSPYTVTIYTKQDNPYNVIPDAPIEIRERLANGTSGSLSIIYSDQEGLIPITQTGAKADSNGQFVFYAEAAQYNAVYESQTVPVDVGLTADTLPSAMINNLSLPYVFDTVADYKAFAVLLPVGKQVMLTDRNATFTVIAGTSTANTFNIIASTVLDQSIQLNTKHGVINVAKAGAIADNGVTNNTAAFSACIAAGLSVFVPKPANGNYYKATGLQLLSGQTIFSYGAEIRAVGGIAIKHDDNSVVDGLKITGDGKAGTATGGVFCSAKFDTRTRNVTISDLNGAAYQTDNSVDRHQGNILSDFVIRDCATGILNGFRGEYGKAVGGTIYGCDTGISISGGNNNFSAVTVTDNDVGVHLQVGQNDSHGVCSGLTINHNPVNIQVDAINAKAFNFSGCAIYAGDIWLNGCEGVMFTGCELSIVEIKEEGARYCLFASNHFVSQITVTPNYNGTFSEVYYNNSNIYNDTSMIRPTFFPEGSYNKATLENNLLNLADGSTTNILDTSSVNKISGNPLFSWQTLFQEDVSKFDLSKKTRFDGGLIHFTGEVNITRSTSYIPEGDVLVELYSTVRGVVGRAHLARKSDDGATLYTNVYRIDVMIARENIEYELRVVNNSGANINVYRDQSGDLVCYCEAWGW